MMWGKVKLAARYGVLGLLGTLASERISFAETVSKAENKALASIADGHVVANVCTTAPTARSSSAHMQLAQAGNDPGTAAAAEAPADGPRVTNPSSLQSNSLNPANLAKLRQVLLGASQALQQQMQAQLQSQIQKAAASTISAVGQTPSTAGSTTSGSGPTLACENACRQGQIQCEANVALNAGAMGTDVLTAWMTAGNSISDYDVDHPGGWPKYIFLPSLPNGCAPVTLEQAFCGPNGQPAASESLVPDELNGCPDVNAPGYYSWQAQLYALLSGPLQQCSAQWQACARNCSN